MCLKFLFFLILINPLVSAFLIGFRIRYFCIFDKPLFFCCVLLWINLTISIFFFFFFFFFGSLSLNYDIGVWFSTQSFLIPWNFSLNELTVAMFVIINFISLLVHFYSGGYMRHDPYFNRFLSYLSLFTFFMLLLVSSGNLIQLFIGWEGVGLCSFLLISFWRTRILANKAAIKAMVVNKFGDFFMLFGFCLLLETLGTVTIQELLNFSFFSSSIFLLIGKTMCWFGWHFHLLDIIGFFLFLGVMAKSAQFGFHTWLPDAMEGPTPVSALIHAATMVTAGVFLLIRLQWLFVLTTHIQCIIVFVGTLTTFYAASVALVQNDLKKIIAYSTCSQLGYMITAAGFFFFNASLFHLIMHAFFKALLFLSAGSIIHTLSDEQDIRKMGGLFYKMPITYYSMLIGTLSLVGFPFTSGFYSKDLILEMIYQEGSYLSVFSYFFGIISVFFTAFYSFRSLILVFFTTPRGYKAVYLKMPRNSWYILLPLIILSVVSLISGFFTFDFFFFMPVNFFVPQKSLSLYIKVFPLILLVVAFLFVYLFYIKYPIKTREIFFSSKFFRECYSFLNKKWYIDAFYNTFIGWMVWQYSYCYSFCLIEKGWLEWLGPTGLVRFLTKLSIFLNKFLTNNLIDYYFFFFFNFIILWILL